MDYKKLAEERKARLVNGAKSYEEWIDNLHDEAKKLWEIRERSIDPIEMEQAAKRSLDILINWREQDHTVSKLFKEPCKSLTLEFVASLQIDEIKKTGEELTDYKILLQIQKEITSKSGKKYSANQIKSIGQLKAYENYLIDNYSFLSDEVKGVLETGIRA